MSSPLRTLAVLALMGTTPAQAERAYVPNEVSGTISVIDVNTGMEIDGSPIPAGARLGQKIQAIAIDRDGQSLWVTDASGDVVVVLDAKSGAIRKTLPARKSPEGISRSPDGLQFAVCLEASNQVLLIDSDTMTESARIPVQGDNPEHCIFSPDGRWLVAGNEESDNVDVIDLAARRSVHLIETDGAIRGMGFLPDGSALYAANESAGAVEVIDPAQWKVVKTIKTGLRAAGVAVHPGGDRVYVTNGGDHNVSVIDVASNAVIATIPVGQRPWNMDFSADGSKLYVANGRSDSVSVIDTGKNEVEKEIPVGKKPWGVVIQ